MVKRNYQSPKNINGRSMRYSPKYNVWSNQEYNNKKKSDIDELTKKLNPNKPFICLTN